MCSNMSISMFERVRIAEMLQGMKYRRKLEIVLLFLLWGYLMQKVMLMK